MKNSCFIVFVALMISGMLLPSTKAQETQSSKLIITFNDFINRGNIDEKNFRIISAKLTDALKNELEKSGRFELWDKEYIKDTLKTMQNVQTFDFRGCSSEQCANKLAEIAKADYSAFATLAKAVSSDTYNISLKLNNISKGKDLPQFNLETANNVTEDNLEITIREWCQTFIKKVPLMGTIRTRDKDDNRYVIITLGKNHKIMPGDIFFVKKEVSGFPRIIGKVKVEKDDDIKNDRSRAYIVEEPRNNKLSGEETVELDDTVRLKKLIEEENKKRKEENKKTFKSTSYDDSSESYGKWKDMLNSKRSLVRFGYGGFGLIQFGDSKLNNYFMPKSGQAFRGDIMYLRWNNGLDIFTSIMYRSHKMKNSKVADLYYTDYLTPLYLGPTLSLLIKSPSKLTITTWDNGLRWGYGFVAGERFDIYILAGMRLAFGMEKSRMKKNRFLSVGAYGGVGLEMTLFPWMSLYAEYNYGYTPMGKSKRNIDGHQLTFGATLRVGGVF